MLNEDDVKKLSDFVDRITSYNNKEKSGESDENKKSIEILLKGIVSLLDYDIFIEDKFKDLHLNSDKKKDLDSFIQILKDILFDYTYQKYNENKNNIIEWS